MSAHWLTSRSLLISQNSDRRVAKALYAPPDSIRPKGCVDARRTDARRTHLRCVSPAGKVFDFMLCTETAASCPVIDHGRAQIGRLLRRGSSPKLLRP